MGVSAVSSEEITSNSCDSAGATPLNLDGTEDAGEEMDEVSHRSVVDSDDQYQDELSGTDLSGPVVDFLDNTKLTE